MTREEFAEILYRFMNAHDRFIIAGHEGPDGDCIGAAVAMGLALTDMGKEVYTFYEGYSDTCKEKEIADLVPRLDVEGAAKAAEKPYAFILLDASEDKRLGSGSFLPSGAVDFICIDHHVQHEKPERLTYVEDHICATCEILYYLFDIMQVQVTPDMAKALYLGLATDTGGFRHQGTTGETYRAAARLIDLGADPTHTLNLEFHTRSFKACKVQAALFQKTKLYEGGIVLAAMSRGDFAKVGAAPEEAGGMVASLIEIEEAETAVVLREVEENKINISFRSKEKVDVAAIARQFGGGGHVRAAGCTLEEPLLSAKYRVLKALRQAVKDLQEESEG